MTVAEAYKRERKEGDVWLLEHGDALHVVANIVKDEDGRTDMPVYGLNIGGRHLWVSEFTEVTLYRKVDNEG